MLFSVYMLLFSTLFMMCMVFQKFKSYHFLYLSLDLYHNCWPREKGGTLMSYKGGLNMTKEGYTCSPWTDSRANWLRDWRFQDGNKGIAGNKCRNPDNDNTPWCYVIDTAKRLDFCDIPSCGKFAKQVIFLICYIPHM